MESLMEVTKETVSGEGEIVDIKIVPFEQAFKSPDKVLAKARNPEQAKQRMYAVFTVRMGDTEFSETHGIPKGSEFDKKKNQWLIKDKFSLIKSLKNMNNWFAK